VDLLAQLTKTSVKKADSLLSASQTKASASGLLTQAKTADKT
jgi:hypothetical protein